MDPAELLTQSLIFIVNQGTIQFFLSQKHMDLFNIYTSSSAIPPGRWLHRGTSSRPESQLFVRNSVQV